MTIWTALAKPHVFPALSPMKTSVETNWSKSYDALRAIIVPLHPLVIEHPSVLIRATPSQLLADSICSYFCKYVDFLVLRAFIEDNPKNLNNTGEMDKFLAGLTHSAAVTPSCHRDRLS